MAERLSSPFVREVIPTDDTDRVPPATADLSKVRPTGGALPTGSGGSHELRGQDTEHIGDGDDAIITPAPGDVAERAGAISTARDIARVLVTPPQ